MRFEKERIEKLLEVIGGLMLHHEQKITEIEYHEGKQDGTPREAFKTGQRWGKRDRFYRFYAALKCPDDYARQRIALQVITGQEGGWDATNPQFLLHANGKRMQGIDINHNVLILTQSATPGEEISLDFEAFSGLIGNLLEFKLSAFILDRDIEQLYYSLRASFEAALLYDENTTEYITIFKHLTNAVNLLDLREAHSREFYQSVQKANEYFEKEYYGKVPSSEATALCIGHTHIDVAWQWRTVHTEKKAERSFSTVMALMEEYPEYRFMSSQPQLYQYIKQNNPKLYSEIKEKVKEGRWETEGGMWVEADCNLASGESLVRQLLFGQKFFKTEFGTDNKVLWLPDVFGYSAALPQIIKKCDMEYFVTSKISWNEFNRVPMDTFMWRGIDGTEVLTQFITIREDNPNESNLKFFATYNGKINPNQIKGGYDQYQQKDINQEILAPIGYGDGGGGTTRLDMEMGRRLAKGIPGMPKTRFGTLRGYMEELDDRVKACKYLPTWVGELYLEYHRGTYTSMAINKKYNRKSENLLQDVELLSSLQSTINQQTYPHTIINGLWEKILLNQFHDILPGSSIREVYEDSTVVYEEVKKDATTLYHQNLQEVGKHIDVKDDGFVIWNTTGFKRSDYINIEDQYFYIEDIPAKGYSYVSPDILSRSSNIVVHDNVLETDLYQVTFDQAWQLNSIICKATGQEVLAGKGNALSAFEDFPFQFDAWDINIYYQEKEWAIDDLQSVEIIEKGQCKVVRVKRNFMKSTIEQDIIFYDKMARIDFETTIDWHEKHTLLKTAFPVNVNAQKATYDIQFGNVERPTHWNTSWDKAKFEVCAHKWGDLSQDDFGVSILNDCKYGYDIKDNVMRLTLLKSATDPNEVADQGLHKFTYSLYPHQGDWRQANVIKAGYFVNNPLVVEAVKQQAGDLPERCSFFTVMSEKENVVMETVKKAEDSDLLIIRIYEGFNREDKVKLSSYFAIDQAYDCNMKEAIISELPVVDGEVEFTIKPYEIKTLGLKLKNNQG